MRALANFISFVFHPIFLYTYLYIIYWWWYPYPQAGMQTEGILLATVFIFIITALAPVALLMVRKVNLTHQDQQQRQRTILVVLVLYIVTYTMFPRNFIHGYMINVLLATIIGLGVAFLVNFKMKISLHASAWGGFVSVILYLLFQFSDSFYFFFIGSVLCAGLVGFSRLYLGAHTNKELYWGYLAGFACTSLVMFFGQNFY